MSNPTAPSSPPSPCHTHTHKPRLILILGPTGTGKSALSLSLATHLNAEIINCDAMQLYRGLPIITNKLSAEEQRGIPHHLLGRIGIEEVPWTVTDYVRRVEGVVGDVAGRGKRAVLVGGTGYYAHGTLFRDGIIGGDEQQGGEEKGGGRLEEMGTEEMLAELRELDPEMARRWHPRDRRKIQRSLEICLRTGRKASEVYREQAEQGNGPVDGNAARAETQIESGGDNAIQSGIDVLRYEPLIFWLSASDTALKARLNARVDTMVEHGLCKEALQLHRQSKQYQDEGIQVDKSKGIWVSIGYKEMESWAEKHLQDPDMYPESSQLAKDCIEAVKAGTRQYAKRQDRYIRIRLANALRQANALDRLFLLDTTDLDRFEDDVVIPARNIAKAFFAGRVLPEARELGELAKSTFQSMEEQQTRSSDRSTRYCEVCDKTLMTQKEWEGHLVSRSHKKCVASKKRKALVAVQSTE